MNKQNIKKRMIIDFESRASSFSDSEKKTKKSLTQSDLDKAKVAAQKEIDQFKSIINDTKKQLEELVIFRKQADALCLVFQDVMLNEFIEPILKGTKPDCMSVESFKNARVEMYYDLIKKYVEKDN